MARFFLGMIICYALMNGCIIETKILLIKTQPAEGTLACVPVTIEFIEGEGL